MHNIQKGIIYLELIERLVNDSIDTKYSRQSKFEGLSVRRV